MNIQQIHNILKDSGLYENPKVHRRQFYKFNGHTGSYTDVSFDRTSKNGSDIIDSLTTRQLEEAGYLVVVANPHYLWIKPITPRVPKPGYVERAKKLIEDNFVTSRKENSNIVENEYLVIDYPLDETVTVKFTHHTPQNKSVIWTENLQKHNAEVRLVKPVKNGTIWAIHFNE